MRETGFFLITYVRRTSNRHKPRAIFITNFSTFFNWIFGKIFLYIVYILITFLTLINYIFICHDRLGWKGKERGVIGDGYAGAFLERLMKLQFIRLTERK